MTCASNSKPSTTIHITHHRARFIHIFSTLLCITYCRTCDYDPNLQLRPILRNSLSSAICPSSAMAVLQPRNLSSELTICPGPASHTSELSCLPMETRVLPAPSRPGYWSTSWFIPGESLCLSPETADLLELLQKICKLFCISLGTGELSDLTPRTANMPELPQETIELFCSPQGTEQLHRLYNCFVHPLNWRTAWFFSGDCRTALFVP